jgi:hypothetical protein
MNQMPLNQKNNFHLIMSILLTVFIFSIPGFSIAAPGQSLSSTETMSDSAFIEMVQKACFDFFWNEANPQNGLIKDRDTGYSPCSIASVGFGLSAICIGIDHGWITRTQGAERVLSTLQTFWTKPQGRDAQGFIGYKGFFYHFLDMNTATRVWNSELSSIDTALLLAGILHAKGYFREENDGEQMIRQLADSIYYRVDWEWMRNFSPNITLGWHPESGFINAWWNGYNEAMIMNILALGSPTHPVPKSTWNAWTSGYSWQTHYGYSYVNFPPLFGHQYSHCWIDFRNIQDDYMNNRGITYFENSRRATLAQRAYCIDNPGNFAGYSENIWGITACDGPAPNNYIARGAPPAQNDDGTIAPTAAGGSIAFTPEESIAALRHMYDTYKSHIWKNYGFRDAFNLTKNWWGPDVIGIDQGAIILMMENYRNGNIWNIFMQNEDIQRGLERAGFEEITSIGEETWSRVPESYQVYQNYPNPFNATTTINFYLPVPAHISLKLYDGLGQYIKLLEVGSREAGEHRIQYHSRHLASGVYYYTLTVDRNHSITRKMIVLN